MKLGSAVGLIAVLCALAASADEGRLSQAKLDKLGLASMQPASDQQGHEVRGRQFYKLMYTVSRSAGDTGPFVDSDVIFAGTPLTFGGIDPPAFNFTPDLNPPNPIEDSTGDISSSTTFTSSGGGFSGITPAPSFTFSTTRSFGSFGWRR